MKPGFSFTVPHRLLFILGLLLMVMVFIVELATPHYMLGTVIYIMAILYMLQFPQQSKYAVILGIVTTVLITLGYLFTAYEYRDNPTVPLNRAFSIFAIWLVVFFTLRYKKSLENEVKQKEQLHAIFDNATEGMLIMNSSGTIVLINRCAEQMFGYREGELTWVKIENLLPSRFQSKHVELRTAFMASPQTRPVQEAKELTGRHKDGSEFPVAVSLSHFRTQEDTFAIAFILDLTEKKKIRERLVQEQALAQTYFELAPVVFIALDKDGIVRLINNYGSHLLGLPKDQIIGKNWFENFLPSEDHDNVYTYFRKIFEGTALSMNYENKILNNSGEELDISWNNSFIRDNDGNIIMTLSAGANITERKKQEKQIAANHENIRYMNEQLEGRVRQRTRQLETAMEVLENANSRLAREIDERNIIETDLAKSQRLYTAMAHNFPEGVIAVMNEDLKFIFADGQDLLQILILGTQSTNPSAEFVNPAFIRGYESELTKVFNGERISYDTAIGDKFYNVASSPLPDHENEIHEILVVIRNITLQKAMERDLLRTIEKEKDLNVLKSRFVTMASHEFRTPLTTILSSVFLLENYPAEELMREKNQLINKIKRSVTNLTELLNDFISIGKLEEGKIKVSYSEIDIRDFLQELVPDMELVRKHNQTIHCQYAGEETKVLLDKQLLRSILLNIISNAIKYSPPDSDIHIKASIIDKNLVLKITDQGIGIPAEEQHHLFKRFYRAHNAMNIEGSGLGLNIVRKYVKLMKGNVGFQSKLNEGTTFTVTLPVAPPPLNVVAYALNDKINSL